MLCSVIFVVFVFVVSFVWMSFWVFFLCLFVVCYDFGKSVFWSGLVVVFFLLFGLLVVFFFVFLMFFWVVFSVLDVFLHLFVGGCSFICCLCLFGSCFWLVLCGSSRVSFGSS